MVLMLTWHAKFCLTPLLSFISESVNMNPLHVHAVMPSIVSDIFLYFICPFVYLGMLF